MGFVISGYADMSKERKFPPPLDKLEPMPPRLLQFGHQILYYETVFDCTHMSREDIDKLKKLAASYKPKIEKISPEEAARILREEKDANNNSE